jgi:hypothetical protein
MKFLEELNALLMKTKGKLKFSNIEDHNNYLEKYRDDSDIVAIEELLKGMTFKDLESKFFINFSVSKRQNNLHS